MPFVTICPILSALSAAFRNIFTVVAFMVAPCRTAHCYQRLNKNSAWITNKAAHGQDVIVMSFRFSRHTDIWCFWVCRNKTDESDNLEAVVTEQFDTGERVFLLNMPVILRSRCCSPIRSSERWQRKQRLGRHSLPDVWHQIAKLLIMNLRC